MRCKEKVIKKVLAFCGIANPDFFFNSLADKGLEISSKIAFGDHHRYKKNDIDRIDKKAGKEGCDVLITTAKDMVKLTKIEALRAQLQESIEREEYERAAQLRDELRAIEQQSRK